MWIEIESFAHFGCLVFDVNSCFRSVFLCSQVGLSLTVTAPASAMKGGAAWLMAFVLLALAMGAPEKGKGDDGPGKEDEASRHPPQTPPAPSWNALAWQIYHFLQNNGRVPPVSNPTMPLSNSVAGSEPKAAPPAPSTVPPAPPKDVPGHGMPPPTAPAAVAPMMPMPLGLGHPAVAFPIPHAAMTAPAEAVSNTAAEAPPWRRSREPSVEIVGPKATSGIGKPPAADTPGNSSKAASPRLALRRCKVCGAHAYYEKGVCVNQDCVTLLHIIILKFSWLKQDLGCSFFCHST